MKTTTRQLLGSLLMFLLFFSCSRPVAYFQPSAREHLAISPAQITPATTGQTQLLTTAQQVAQANASLDQVDALVSTNSKPAINKTVQKRLNRVRTLLTAASAQASMSPVYTVAPKKMNVVERLMLKKIDKKINKQLAPANPDKAMAVKGILAIGAVLILVGLILVVLTTGGGFAIGAIALAAGIVLVLVELI